MTAQHWVVYLRGSIVGPRVVSLRPLHGKTIPWQQAPLTVQQYLNIDGASSGQPVLRDYLYEVIKREPRPDGLKGLAALDADLKDDPGYRVLHGGQAAQRGVDRRLIFSVPIPPKSPRPVTVREVAEALQDAEEGPGAFQRAVYKHTDCGPTVGLHLTGTVEGGRAGWLYASDLYQLGTWAQFSQRTGGRPCVDYLSVSSIVEGIDAEVDPIEVPCRPLRTLRRRFWAAVEAVNTAAVELWKDTHGC